MNRENIFEYLRLKDTNIDYEVAVQIANLAKMILDLENKDWGKEETLKNFTVESISLIKDIIDNLEQTYRNGFDLGYGAGYEEGYNTGFDDGHDKGYEEGYEYCYKEIENEKENHA